MTRIAIESAAGTVGELLAEGVHRLREALGSDANGTPELDAELLLAEALRAPRAQLRSHPEEQPAACAALRYRELIERRAAGEPVAYLLGRKGFWTLELAVSRAVLVPRPETELLVERALALRPEPRGRVADLGTGSGAIALALASERPAWEVVATDLSAAALAVARANAAALGLSGIVFRRGSWCAALPSGAFDLLLSNPPYIAAGEAALGALGYEPSVALTPGPDGLACS